MKNKTLQDFRDAFFGDDDRKDAGDKHFYGVVKSLKTNANGKVVGYYVNLGGDSGTTYCRKLAGAKVGNTVMVTLMGNSKVATVTGTLNGDTDVEDVKEPLDDLIGRVDDGEFTPAGTIIQYCLATAMVIPSGGSFDDIQYTAWSEDLPAYQVGYYYWMRTVTVMEDETEIESEPVFALSAQTAAEANDIATSTNNYFWHDNTGAWITKVDQDTYQDTPTGPAVQLGASGMADYLDGILLASRTASGTTFYGIDNGTRKELVTYGLSGTVFNSAYPFMIGNNNSYIKWERDSSTQQWKIKIAADVIEMGGVPVENGGRWYTGTGITGTSTTAQVFSGSGVTSAVVGDMYLNTSTNNTYRCTKGGGPSVAKWVYECNIKGTDITSQYVTFSSSTGLFVHDNTSSSVSYGNGVQVKSDGVYLRKSGTAVATFNDDGMGLLNGNLGNYYDSTYGNSFGAYSYYYPAVIKSSYDVAIRSGTASDITIQAGNDVNIYTNYGATTIYGKGSAEALFVENGYINNSYGYNQTVTSSPNVRFTEGCNVRRTTNTSSRRYKNSIGPIMEESIKPEHLYDVEIVQYKYNETELTDPNDRRYKQYLPGYIAEQVYEVYPIAVDLNDDGQPDGVNIHYFIPAMLDLIQKQKAEIDNLSNRIDELERSA